MSQQIGIDFGVLAEGLGEKQIKTASLQRVAVEGNKHLFVNAVADLFRKNDEDGLWKIETAEDGKDYFTRTEIVDPSQPIVQESSEWKAVADKEQTNVTLSYRDIPIKRFAAKEFKFAKQEVNEFCKHVISKTSDVEFRKHVLAEVTPYTKDLLTKQCPELLK